MSERIAIHWFRRDLRLADNTALIAALRTGARVVPLFIFDPAILRSARTGAPRVAFMLRALHALDERLRERGSALLVRFGHPHEVLPAIVREIDAGAIYANADYTPYARRRDERLRQALTVPLHLYHDLLLRAPGEVLKDDGAPFTVFTPFMKRWRMLPPPPGVASDNAGWGRFHTLDDIRNPGLPALAALGFGSTIAVPEADEVAAQRALARFIDGPIYIYSETRNALVTDPFASEASVGSSYLSPYLRFGILSPRQVYWAAQRAGEVAPTYEARQSVKIYVNELIWREFYHHILYHFPHVDRASFRPEYDAVPWRDAPDELAAWQEGRTGYPIVDAAMRQLRAIGWLPNRARMIVASFLTKDLLIHWRAGEQYFMQWLIDGDVAANNGGWQWTAGTGTDAQPYFRIFNPVSQSRKFDPDGHYIRRWVPELRAISSPHIHTPWEMENLPVNYPPPLIDHAVARERTLAAFRVVKG